MSAPRSARPDPATGQPRTRPSDERAQLADAGRTTRRIAWLASALAAGALALTAWRAIVPAGSACQTTAWDTTPKTEDLPVGLDDQRDPVRRRPQADDGRRCELPVGRVVASRRSSTRPSPASPTGAEDAVTRSADAAKAAGQTVTERDDLGDQAFSAADDSGATFIQLRHGDVVVYLAASGDRRARATSTRWPPRSTRRSAATAASSPSGRPRIVPSERRRRTRRPAMHRPSRPTRPRRPRARPRRRSRRASPSTVGDVALTVGSLTGEDVLGDDQGSRAIVAALRADGHHPADLKIAQASDEDGGSRLVITGLSVDGMSQTALKALDDRRVAGGDRRRRQDRGRDGRRTRRDPRRLRRRRAASTTCSRTTASPTSWSTADASARRRGAQGAALGDGDGATPRRHRTDTFRPAPHPRMLAATMRGPGPIRGGRSEEWDDVREQLVAWAEDCRVQGEVDLDEGRLSDLVNERDIVVFFDASLVALEDGHEVGSTRSRSDRTRAEPDRGRGSPGRPAAPPAHHPRARAARGRPVHGDGVPPSIAARPPLNALTHWSRFLPVTDADLELDGETTGGPPRRAAGQPRQGRQLRRAARGGAHVGARERVHRPGPAGDLTPSRPRHRCPPALARR